MTHGIMDNSVVYISIFSTSKILKLSPFEYIHGANSSVERDLWFILEENVVLRLFFKPFSVSLETIVFLVDPYY